MNGIKQNRGSLIHDTLFPAATPPSPASAIQQLKRLTDDVGSLCVVRELVLIWVLAVLVERALVAGLQNRLQKLQRGQAGTQAVDPQSLLVTVDGPANVCSACAPKIQQSGHRRRDTVERWSRQCSRLPMHRRSSGCFRMSRGVRPSGRLSYTCDNVFSCWSSSSSGPTEHRERWNPFDPNRYRLASDADERRE